MMPRIFWPRPKHCRRCGKKTDELIKRRWCSECGVAILKGEPRWLTDENGQQVEFCVLCGKAVPRGELSQRGMCKECWVKQLLLIARKERR